MPGQLTPFIEIEDLPVIPSGTQFTKLADGKLTVADVCGIDVQLDSDFQPQLFDEPIGLFR